MSTPYTFAQFEPLYTCKGSKIFWHNYQAGKHIGSKIYVHKKYKWAVLPEKELCDALDILKAELPDFKFNCICYDNKKNIMRFDEAPDFDTAKEPAVGWMVSINLNTDEVTKSHSNSIWHHKWLWVRPEYLGFDVKESYEWSKFWLSKLKETASGNKEKWYEQSQKYNIERK